MDGGLIGGQVGLRLSEVAGCCLVLPEVVMVITRFGLAGFDFGRSFFLVVGVCQAGVGGGDLSVSRDSVRLRTCSCFI